MIATIVNVEVVEDRIGRQFIRLKVLDDYEQISFVYASHQAEFTFKRLLKWCDIPIRDIIDLHLFKNKIIPVKEEIFRGVRVLKLNV